MTDLVRGYSGAQKAALVLMQLGRERAAEVLRQFSEQEAEEIVEHIARLSVVDDAAAAAALYEFHEKVSVAPNPTRGGRETASELLHATFGQDKAEELLGRLPSSMADRPFEFLDTADAGGVAALLAGELPETIAFILLQVSTSTASAVLGRLEPAQRLATAQAVATARGVSPEVVGLLADTVRHLARSIVIDRGSQEIVGGVQMLVDMINRADVATERDLMAQLEETDPALAEEVRAKMFGFDDIVKLEARDVQQVVRGIDAAQLALAIKGASAEIVETITSNMSERNREDVMTELGYLGSVRRSQVDDARAAIVQVVRSLEASGEITFRRGGADEPEEELVD